MAILTVRNPDDKIVRRLRIAEQLAKSRRRTAERASLVADLLEQSRAGRMQSLMEPHPA